MRGCSISKILKVVILMLLVVVGSQAQEAHVRVRAKQYESSIAQAAARHKVDPYLLWTIAYLESRFRPGAVSYKGGRPCAYGMMQFVPRTAARYGLQNPHHAHAAVDAAARYVRDLAARFNNRADLILAAYNSGEGTVEAYRLGHKLVLPTGKIINATLMRTGGIPPYRETRGYVTVGTAIYNNIARANIFNFALKPLVTEDASSAGSDEAMPKPERSLSVADSPAITAFNGEESEDPPTVPAALPPVESSTPEPPTLTRSIYIR